MNAVELRARSQRVRSGPDVEADLQLACRSIGALAGAARMTATPVDRTALANAVEGLQRLLVESRVQEVTP